MLESGREKAWPIDTPPLALWRDEIRPLSSVVSASENEGTMLIAVITTFDVGFQVIMDAVKVFHCRNTQLPLQWPH